MKKLLIANRGEIAVRVIRTANEMGLTTVAVVSDADRSSFMAQIADEVVVIGPPSASLSYLNADAVLRAAQESGADAIHPGYGFLSENADFARKVIDAGLTWVGASPETIELMGNKSRARQVAKEAGVPTLPGSDAPVGEDDDLDAIGAQVGFPLVVKASAGGGGRGIRHVAEPADLKSTVEVAKAEALAAFGSSDVYLERFVAKARHVEVQVFGDGETFVHFGDRDCSMQRRQQKVLEEAPAPDLPHHVRQQMRESSVQLARQTRYMGAGTVEFLYDADTETVAFIEVNTRIQVEHPVTEMITGVDLVREQLRVAAGEKLGYTQDDIVFIGHSIEFRINAEDPSNGFMPSPGVIESLVHPGGLGVRVDFGYVVGDVVPPFYDSLLGKIIVWAPTRDGAIARAQRMFEEFRIEGVKTTASMLNKLVSLDDFTKVSHHTKYIESVPGLLDESVPNRKGPQT